MDIKILCQNIANNPNDFKAERLEELFKAYALLINSEEKKIYTRTQLLSFVSDACYNMYGYIDIEKYPDGTVSDVDLSEWIKLELDKDKDNIEILNNSIFDKNKTSL